MRSVLLALVTVAGCGPSRAPSRPAPTRTPYLMLFEQGHTFALPARTGGTVRCTVAEVKPVGDSTVSRLACDAPHRGLLVVGTWVATPAGLYHPYLPVDDPDELALLGEDDLLIGAIPKERDHSRAVARTTETIESFIEDGSWCVRHTTSAGDDLRRYALCFDGTRVTGGSDLVRSSSENQQVEFGRAPQEPEPDDEAESEPDS